MFSLSSFTTKKKCYGSRGGGVAGGYPLPPPDSAPLCTYNLHTTNIGLGSRLYPVEELDSIEEVSDHSKKKGDITFVIQDIAA